MYVHVFQYLYSITFQKISWTQVCISLVSLNFCHKPGRSCRHCIKMLEILDMREKRPLLKNINSSLKEMHSSPFLLQKSLHQKRAPFLVLLGENMECSMADISMGLFGQRTAPLLVLLGERVGCWTCASTSWWGESKLWRALVSSLVLKAQSSSISSSIGSIPAALLLIISSSLSTESWASEPS